MPRSREQKLIDLVFEIAQISARSYSSVKSPDDYTKHHRESHMLWVARQLRNNGFDTVPVGMSWGVLKQQNDSITTCDHCGQSIRGKS